MADAAPPVQTLFDIRAHRHDCETLLPKSDVNAVTTLKSKSKRKERDSPEATELAFSGPSEYMGANPPVNRENVSLTPALTAIAATTTAPAVIIATYDSNPLVSAESNTKEPKICGRCTKAVKDTPALKRHCSEVHKQDIYGNPISIELFPCHIATCGKHREPFKRREKLAQHIRAFHTEKTKEHGVNFGISSEERDAALTTNDTANAGKYFGGNYGAARLSARVHSDSDEVGAWSLTVLGEPIEAQSGPIANSCEMGLCYAPNIPVDANFQPNATSEKRNGDITSSILDLASMYTSRGLPLEIDINRTIGDAVEIQNLAQMPNEGSVDFNGVIDPALMQSFPFGGKLPDRSSPSALSGLYEDLFRQIATGEWPVTVDKTAIVQYDTLDEARQALLDARKKTLQKLQFINQQIDDFERRKQNRNEAVGVWKA